jgi:hypothetical protein
MSTLKQKAGDEQRPPSEESRLLDYAQRLARFRADRRAIQIHLSRLKSYNRRDHHIRIAANTFENLVRQFDGQIFVLSNQDIVFVCKEPRVEVIDDAVTRVKYLFSEDPLVQGGGRPGADAFCTWYDIERSYDEFLAVVTRLHDEERRRSKPPAAPAASSANVAASAPPAFDGHRLGELVDAIQRADLSNLMRRQPVAAMTQGDIPKPIFRELYISIGELRETIMPDHDITADRWLFRHLTQALDRRMLRLLVKNDDGAIANSFSINVNVTTLLSDDFLQFDASLRSGARGTIVLELQLIDIFADLNAYTFARDFVKERGYRVCLDGVNHQTLPYVDRERLGLDLVKLLWRPDMLDYPGDKRQEFCDLVEKLGRARAILAHCDTDAAVEFGLACGISLFQGRFVDKLLSSRSDLAALKKRRASAA